MNTVLQTSRTLLLVAAVLVGLAPAAQAQTVLFNFEDGVQGWSPGENTGELLTIETKPIGGGQTTTAFEGQFMLEAVPPTGDALPQSTDWRAIEYTFDTPVDWTSTPLLKLALSGYGAGPNSRRHEARITVLSGDESVQEEYFAIKDEPPTFVNAWEVLELDLTSFSGLGNITGLRVEYRNNDDGSEGTPEPFPWGGRFQLDLVTVESTGDTSSETLPELFGRSALYPNPAAGPATLELTVTSPQQVTAEVFDLLGRSVLTAFEGAVAPGTEMAIPVAADRLVPGLYLVRVQGERYVQTHRFVVVR